MRLSRMHPHELTSASHLGHVHIYHLSQPPRMATRLSGLHEAVTMHARLILRPAPSSRTHLTYRWLCYRRTRKSI